MKNFGLKFTLGVCQWLMSVKRALTFLFSTTLTFLEKFGQWLARFCLFPIYRILLPLSREFSWHPERWLGRRFLFYLLLMIAALALAGSESRAWASNQYLGGRHSLLFSYLGPAKNEDEEIFEESGINSVATGAPWTWSQGFLTPTPTAEKIDGTLEILSLAPENQAVIPPVILPGVEIGTGRYKIISYTVQPGDTLGGLAQKFQISLETILIENKLTARSVLRPGNVLTILPTSGISHKIKKGDTAKKLATLYRADAQKILDFNRLADDNLPMGEIVVIPEGRKPAAPSYQPMAGVRPPPVRTREAGLLWPTTSRRITQYFKWRHTGIDIAMPTGSAIYAAEDGVVEAANWNRGGYGYQIILSHPNGLRTRYAHNNKNLVTVGQQVQKGDVIALLGSTGRSTGPHLHFEVIVRGVPVNPFLYVK